MTVVAVVTDDLRTLATARSAVDEALATDAALAVVGVVTPRFHAPQPATGQRERQRGFVTAAVASALALADSRGVEARSAIVSGRPLGAGLRQAHARGASALYVPAARSRPLGGRASPAVERIQLTAPRPEATDNAVG